MDNGQHKVEDRLIYRLNASVEFLKDKLPFSVGRFGLGRIDSNTISVRACCRFTQLDNITKAIVIENLEIAKNEFAEMLQEATIFQDYIKDKELEFLMILDWGNSGFEVCTERNGVAEFSEFIKG